MTNGCTPKLLLVVLLCILFPTCDIFHFKGKKQENALKELFTEWPVPEGQSIESLPPSDMEIQLRSFVSSNERDSNGTETN
jgi:hypothetical protein